MEIRIYEAKSVKHQMWLYIISHTYFFNYYATIYYYKHWLLPLMQKGSPY